MDPLARLNGKLDAPGTREFESGRVFALANPSGFPRPAPDLARRVESWPIRGWGLKNPTWDPRTRELHPGRLARQADASAMVGFLESFHLAAAETLLHAMPHLNGSLVPDRVSWRPWELATRLVRWNARDDLFHIDHFPKRPSMGRRVIRVFMNAGTEDEIVWANTNPLGQLLDDWRKYGQPFVFRDLGAVLRDAAGKDSRWWRPQKGVSLHDAVFKAIHDRLKRDEAFQEGAARKIHRFPPGAVWMAMTDLCCHSFLRGSWLVDATWFLPIDACLHPELAPCKILGTITQEQRGTMRIPMENAA